jgi:hypothetical protein
MKIGDVIWVRAHKADGECYQWWQGTVTELDEQHVVVLTPCDTPVHHINKALRHTDYSDRATYRFDKPYTFIESFNAEGNLVELYLDICSPPRIVGNEVHYVDHELDVAREMPAPAYVMDEDEFAEAALAYGYTPEFQAWCYAVVHEALAVANAVPPAIASQT